MTFKEKIIWTMQYGIPLVAFSSAFLPITLAMRNLILVLALGISIIAGYFNRRKDMNYRCPDCGEIPEVRTTGGMTTIHCCQLLVAHQLHWVALARWKRLCRLLSHDYDMTAELISGSSQEIILPELKGDSSDQSS